jgi:hypothetical protein
MVPLTFAADGTTEWHFCSSSRLYPRDLVCSDARIGQTRRVAFGLDALRRERGKLTPRGPASCCWTGPRTTTSSPRRLATSATVQLLRLSRTTRAVTVRPVDLDTACQPPVAGSSAASPDSPSTPPSRRRLSRSQLDRPPRDRLNPHVPHTVHSHSSSNHSAQLQGDRSVRTSQLRFKASVQSNSLC